MLKIPKVAEIIQQTIVEDNEFDLRKLKTSYENAIKLNDQLSILIVGIKGSGKTSLALKIIEALDLEIYPELIIRTLPQLVRVYKLIVNDVVKLPYLIIDDVGNIVEKWGSSSKIHKLIYKMYNIDRPFIPLIILTDTFSLAKHFRELSKIYVITQKLDLINSLARFYQPYIDPKYDRVKKRRLGYMIYEHYTPDWLRNQIDESRKNEIRYLLEELEYELILRGYYDRYDDI